MKNKLRKLALTGMLVALPFFGCEKDNPVIPEEVRYGNVVGKVTQPYITEDERVAYKPYLGINVEIPRLDRATATDSLGNFDFREVEEGIYEVQANTKYGVLSKAINTNNGYFDERYQTTKKDVNVLGEKPLGKSLGKSMYSTLEDTLEMSLIPQIGFLTQILHGHVYTKDGKSYDQLRRGLWLFGALTMPPEGWPEEPDWVRIKYLQAEEMIENEGRYAFYIGDKEYYSLSSDGHNATFEFDTITARTHISAYKDSLGIIEADAFLTEDEQGEDE